MAAGEQTRTGNELLVCYSEGHKQAWLEQLAGVLPLTEASVEAARNSWRPVAGAPVYSESTQAFAGLEGAWTPLRALEEPPLNLKGTRPGRMVARIFPGQNHQF